MPNLLSSIPVVMYLWVCASTRGLILSAIGAFFLFLEAICSITSISGIDSQLKQKMPASRALLISESDLPTPANAIFEDSNPADMAASISFQLTQSAPNPYEDIISRIRGFAFDFNA